jgi:hypothetical protein
MFEIWDGAAGMVMDGGLAVGCCSCLALKFAIRDSAVTPTGVDRIDQTCYNCFR